MEKLLILKIDIPEGNDRDKCHLCPLSALSNGSDSRYCVVDYSYDGGCPFENNVATVKNYDEIKYMIRGAEE